MSRTKNRKYIRKHTVLVFLIGMLQLTVMLVGTKWVGGRMRQAVHRSIQTQTLANCEQTAKQSAQQIDKMRLRNIEFSASQKKLQSLIDSIEVPNGGFITIVENGSGRVLIKPSNPDQDLQLGATTGQQDLDRTFDIPPSNPNGYPLAGRNRSGAVEIHGQKHLVAVSKLNGLNAQLCVHQRDSHIAAIVDNLISPFEILGAIAAGVISLLSVLSSGGLVSRYENRADKVNRGLAKTVAERDDSLTKTRDAVIFGLAKLAEYRDNDTGTHLDRIREYAVALANAMRPFHSEINDLFIANLALASSLHDIGKVGIPDAVLLKPGRLTPQEREIMEQHSKLGANCLLAIRNRLGTDDFLQMALDIALCHHERVDGTGYPMGLIDGQIPLSAMIVSLADVYDALRTKRVYKPAMSHEEARCIILEGAGSQFHFEVVEAFTRIEDEFQAICDRYLRTVAAPDVPLESMISSNADSSNASRDKSSVAMQNTGSTPVFKS